jgi:flagellar protein FlaG
MDTASVQPPVASQFVLQPQPRPEEVAERRHLIKAIRAVNASELFGQNSELTFVLDRETQRPLIRIVDRKTQEVIRQIPAEYVLRMAEELKTARP